MGVMPSVLVLIKGENLNVQPRWVDDLEVRSRIKSITFLTSDNGRAEYELKHPTKISVYFRGNPKYLEYANNKIVIIIGRINQFEVRNKEGITKVYELRDPVILLNDLTEQVEYENEMD